MRNIKPDESPVISSVRKSTGPGGDKRSETPRFLRVFKLEYPRNLLVKHPEISSNPHMKNKLLGWELIEGTLNMWAILD
jgi:hypothetical protein